MENKSHYSEQQKKHLFSFGLCCVCSCVCLCLCLEGHLVIEIDFLELVGVYVSTDRHADVWISPQQSLFMHT